MIFNGGGVQPPPFFSPIWLYNVCEVFIFGGALSQNILLSVIKPLEVLDPIQ
jgi:hypothetical protein